MDYTSQLSAYKVLVNQLVGSKISEDSIDPTDVASIGIQLADLLLPILNGINDFAITGGTLPPDNLNGVNLDLYIQGGSSLVFWRKRDNIWAQEASVDLGIQIVDGNITLQASVDDQTVTVSAGSWSINNVIYNKAVQSQFLLTAADLNYNRIDSVIADNAGNVGLLDGVASSSPTPAALPANSIIIAYVYIPAQSSGDLPYISDSNASPSTVIDDAIVSLVKTWSSEKLNRMAQPWSASLVPLYGVRWHDIGGIKMLFYSLTEGNTSEPTLAASGGNAWTDIGINGYPDQWNSYTTYGENDYRWITESPLNFRIYRSKVAGNIDNNPATSPDKWENIGRYKFPYSIDTNYDETDFVVDTVSPYKNYISRVDDNTFPFDYVFPGVSSWQLIGISINDAANSETSTWSSDKIHSEIEAAAGSVITTLNFTQADLIEESYGGVWYLPLNVMGGGIVSISYTLSSGLITNYIDSSQAVTNLASSPDTKISGFPSNATQTIRIKIA